MSVPDEGCFRISSPVCSGVRVTRSFVLCVMFYRSLFVLLSFFVWPLWCLSFDLRCLIIPLVSANPCCSRNGSCAIY